MAAGQSWVSELRAETLATIVLTRHEGVDVIPIARYTARRDVDLLVRIEQAGTPSTIEFAVVTWGVRGPAARAKRPLRIRVDPERIERAALPVLLAVFDVDAEEGFFGWLNEPVVASDGRAVLRPNRAFLGSSDANRPSTARWSDLARLDDRAVDEIVGRVADWYAMRARLTASSVLQLVRAYDR